MPSNKAKLLLLPFSDGRTSDETSFNPYLLYFNVNVTTEGDVFLLFFLPLGILLFSAAGAVLFLPARYPFGQDILLALNLLLFFLHLILEAPAKVLAFALVHLGHNPLVFLHLMGAGDQDLQVDRA